LTRNGTSSAAVELGSSTNVTILEGNPLDESTLWNAFKGINAAFVNTTGFAIGEKSEIYWGIRVYEIAYAAGAGGCSKFALRCLHDINKNLHDHPAILSAICPLLKTLRILNILRPTFSVFGELKYSMPIGSYHSGRFHPSYSAARALLSPFLSTVSYVPCFSVCPHWSSLMH
jgi:hypothetical protein